MIRYLVLNILISKLIIASFYRSKCFKIHVDRSLSNEKMTHDDPDYAVVTGFSSPRDMELNKKKYQPLKSALRLCVAVAANKGGNVCHREEEGKEGNGYILNQSSRQAMTSQRGEDLQRKAKRM